MQVIEQSHEVLKMDDISLIEAAGRTCYKSEEKIGCSIGYQNCPGYDSDTGNVYCMGALCRRHSCNKFAVGLIKKGHDAMVEHGSATVRFITNRGVTHELVRHRMASFGQESTRYVNYGGNNISFILPVWLEDKPLGKKVWLAAMKMSEWAYNALLSAGWRPEEAREVLPNSLKTEIVVTANYREWRHILRLRAIGTTGKPHPQMQALMMPVLVEFEKKLPALFGDLRHRV